MPTVNKINPPPNNTEKKKRGRPVGSKNKPKYASDDQQETLYRYTAKDGCSIETSLKNAQLWCRHYYPMKREK